MFSMLLRLREAGKTTVSLIIKFRTFLVRTFLVAPLNPIKIFIAAIYSTLEFQHPDWLAQGTIFSINSCKVEYIEVENIFIGFGQVLILQIIFRLMW